MKKNVILFKFYNYSNIDNKKKIVTELFTNEHIEEIRQRCFQTFFIILLFILISFSEIKSIVNLLEKPVETVHFFKTSPDEYFH